MQDYVGEIRLFAGNRVRKGWVFCEGQFISKSKYGHLAHLLSEESGRLKVPDLREAQPSPDVRYAMCTSGTYPGIGV